MPYPLKMKTMGRYSYFQKREEWKITDMLMNPMILMMVLPLLLITVLPKMMNDPETKREMEQMQANMNVQNQVSTLAIIKFQMLDAPWQLECFPVDNRVQRFCSCLIPCRNL